MLRMEKKIAEIEGLQALYTDMVSGKLEGVGKARIDGVEKQRTWPCLSANLKAEYPDEEFVITIASEEVAFTAPCKR